MAVGEGVVLTSTRYVELQQDIIDETYDLFGNALRNVEALFGYTGNVQDVEDALRRNFEQETVIGDTVGNAVSVLQVVLKGSETSQVTPRDLLMLRIGGLVSANVVEQLVDRLPTLAEAQPADHDDTMS